MKIKYEIKGITLDVWDLVKIHEYYMNACTAEYIIDNYDVTEEEAMKLAAIVRHYMNKYSISEEDAIYEVMQSK
jgi:hypothetical protein